MISKLWSSRVDGVLPSPSSKVNQNVNPHALLSFTLGSYIVPVHQEVNQAGNLEEK